jgi:hypothetical protein
MDNLLDVKKDLEFIIPKGINTIYWSFPFIKDLYTKLKYQNIKNIDGKFYITSIHQDGGFRLFDIKSSIYNILMFMLKWDDGGPPLYSETIFHSITFNKDTNEIQIKY